MYFKYTLTVGLPNGYDKKFSEFLQNTVSPKFPGFTVRYVVGYWNGEQEQVAEIMILSDSYRHHTVENLAAEYNQQFDQQCVLLQIEKAADARFIDRRTLRPEEG